MVAKLTTIAFAGIEANFVDVQVHLAPGHNAFVVVGLPDKAIAESRDRVRAALNAVGVGLPYDRITINLSPADLPKEGSHYDLPIALGLLVATEALPPEALEDYVIMGELGLDGSIRPVPGALPAAMAALEVGKGLICPLECGAEAAWSGLGDSVQGGIKGGIIAADNLSSLVQHLKGEMVLPTPRAEMLAADADTPDLADIRGQEAARLALEVAAAGGHNLLMVGPPGAGKSMLASRLPSIMPELTPSERLQISMVESLAAARGGVRMAARRPYRAPHHSASMAALIGGGRNARPGEISLAHNGVLFLDELPEFSRQALDALRQPIETGRVEVARAAAHVTYPARFQLVAAMNPCRCGHADDPALACHRLPICMQDYMGRVSGPMLDRFDIRIDVPPVHLREMLAPQSGETSAAVRARVEQARAMQMERARANGINPTHDANADYLNATLEGDYLLDVARPDAGGQKLLDQVVERATLSARGFGRVLRVARTLADLSGRANPNAEDTATALQWRGIILRD